MKKKEELPSFLSSLTKIREDFNTPPKPTVSDSYLGPIFFGQCNEFHPPLHSINFNSFRHVQEAYLGRETIKDLFLPKNEVVKQIKAVESVKLKYSLKKKLFYSDPFPHKCHGTRKAFVPEIRHPIIDLGETTSIIEGETTLEIPLYRLKKVCSGIMETEFEIVKYSDIQEKKRNFMTYTERISHIHFPKQFATVSVIGPTIPSAVTITKLPSKRKCEMNLLIESKVKKSLKDETEMKNDKSEEVKKEPEFKISAEEQLPGSSHDSEENLEIKHDEDLTEYISEQNTQETKEAEEVTDEMGETDETDVLERENEEVEETEINEENKENENQDEESSYEKPET